MAFQNTTNINPDLAKERRAATFQVERLTNLLDGGAERTERRREIQALAINDPVLTGHPPLCFLPRSQQYDIAVNKATRVFAMLEEMQLTTEERGWLAQVAFPMEGSAEMVHTIMFLPTILTQASEEQKNRWLPMIRAKRYIGAYSQTELGHGSHVRGLETTATYDPVTEEFVLHTPTITATKWWAGGLGKTCNCAVVMAQLITHGVFQGIFPFFVVFRDLQTHEPLPGITVGDVGPKMGFNTMDNGFLKFDHFRIPRENMLMRLVEVRKDGTFLRKSRQKKPAYLTLTMTRVGIIRVDCVLGLGLALTIAVRYSAVRRQSELQPGAPEPQVLDYQTQQYKLFPVIANAYAYKFAADSLEKLVKVSSSKLQDDDDSMMPELHALSSVLKAYCSYNMCLGMDECRRACGGHGYSESSGLPKIYTTLVSVATVEGEISVLLLQAARYLLKCVDRTQRGEPLSNSAAYIAKTGNNTCTIDESLSVAAFIDAFEHRARRMIHEVAMSLERELGRNVPDYEAKNRHAVELCRASVSHCEAFIVRASAESIKEIDDVDIANVMSKLCQLYAVNRLVNQSGDFIVDGYLSSQQLSLLREAEVALLADIRPDAVALVDAFDYPDEALGSVLGRYDGQVYENLYKWALASPLNKSEVHESYYKYLQPMMKAKI